MLHAHVTLLRGLTCLILWHIYSSIKNSWSPKFHLGVGGAGSVAIQGLEGLTSKLMFIFVLILQHTDNFFESVCDFDAYTYLYHK